MRFQRGGSIISERSDHVRESNEADLHEIQMWWIVFQDRSFKRGANVHERSGRRSASMCRAFASSRRRSLRMMVRTRKSRGTVTQ